MLLSVVGGLAGLAALVWRAYDEVGSYLRISVKVESPKSGWTTILSTVENKGYRRKKLTWAFLLIGPENESPVETAIFLLQDVQGVDQISYTNDLFRMQNCIDEAGIRLECRALIPLTFFYSENIAISDETLTYKSPLNVNDFPTSIPFSVRLFVSGAGRLHRSTHDCFIIDNPPATAD